MSPYRDNGYPPDFNSADPLGVSSIADNAVGAVSAVTVQPPLPAPAGHPPFPQPTHPLPTGTEQLPGPSTAPIDISDVEDPPLYRNGSFPGEERLNSPRPSAPPSAAPYPGSAYPDNAYPSTEYPAPAPSIRPADHNAVASVSTALTPSGMPISPNGVVPPPDRPVAPDGAPSRLMTSALLPTRQETASRGWRKLVFQASRGAVNLGPSADEARHRRLVAHIRTPLYDCHRIAIMSLKGGVGKTTTTVALGSTLASLRGDRVVAIDANPDRGTLGAKVPRTCTNTVRDLLDNADLIHRYVDVRRYLSQADSRLEVLASANDPEISQAFADTDYLAVDDVLQRYYSILLTDCGTGILHSAMPAVLKLADTLVIVSSSSADGGSSASATLDWLDAHGYAAQVREAVTVISTFPANGEAVDLNTLERHFAARTRRVVQVPYDPHLAIGGRIVLEEMRKPTRQAFLEIAGAIAERFGLEGSHRAPVSSVNG
jgi:MinD-like ATPase involved in chromosome partitioning or flagellar assembly